MKKTISLNQPAFVFYVVLGSSIGRWRGRNRQGSCRFHELLPHKFPPIREDTLFSASPVLNETAGNIIDFYGSCDYNPLGEDEVLTQRKLRRHNLAGSD